MAEKKILTVDLYDNVLTEQPGDYSGKIQITGTLHNREVAERFVADRTEYRAETIENILNITDKIKIEAIAEGKSLVDLTGQFLLNIGGSFDGKKTDYRSADNPIGVTFTPSAELFKALENIYVNADIATVGPMIEEIVDSTTKSRNGQLTAGKPAVIKGSNILLKGDDPSVGVYFTPEAGGEPIKADLIVANTNSQIIVSLPELSDGQYYLSVTTQAGSNYKMVKTPRTYQFPVLLTAGTVEEGGEEEERPGGL